MPCIMLSSCEVLINFDDIYIYIIYMYQNLELIFPPPRKKEQKCFLRFACSLKLTFCMCCLILMSDGWIMCPVSWTFPWTTSASSGRSVLMPTLPVWTIDSGVVPRCQHSSASLSNWPGFEAFGARKKTRKKMPPAAVYVHFETPFPVATGRKRNTIL